MQKVVLCLVLLLSLTVAALAKTNAVESFLSFKATHQKAYSSPEEETLRFEIFQNNIRLAEQWNRELNTDAFGVTSPFSDMTQEEFAEQYLMNPAVVAQALQARESTSNDIQYEPEELLERPPEGVSTFDWSIKNPSSITPVKDQGGCGSCWAFSATETLESQWVINGHSQVILAPQQYVDCTYSNYDGCNGGWYGDAWNYAKGTTGQADEPSYPYKGVYSGGCNFNTATAKVQVNGIVNIADENALMTYVTNVGPASVAVDASRWYLYSGGGTVYPAQNCTGGIDHAVVVTGYKNVNGQDVWTVRNSWNTWWGNSGYIYVPMGSNACSIGSYAQGVQTPSSNVSPSATKKPASPSPSGTRKSQSATRKSLSATRKSQSATRKSLSATRKSQSATRKSQSATRKSLSATRKSLSRTRAPSTSRTPQPSKNNSPFPIAACVDQINKYRAQVGAPAIANNTAQQTCVNGQSKSDYTANKAHYAFGQCGEYGQCECPGWGNTNQILDCLAMMFAEGPPPAGGYNHYSIMTDPGYKSVTCGFYDNGSGNVWMTQDYFY